jgi:predicted RNA-binding protein YlqC (UPF0109 family)
MSGSTSASTPAARRGAACPSPPLRGELTRQETVDPKPAITLAGKSTSPHPAGWLPITNESAACSSGTLSRCKPEGHSWQLHWLRPLGRAPSLNTIDVTVGTDFHDSVIDDTVLQVRVSHQDRGKIIGVNGRSARALRVLMGGMSKAQGTSVIPGHSNDRIGREANSRWESVS